MITFRQFLEDNGFDASNVLSDRPPPIYVPPRPTDPNVTNVATNRPVSTAKGGDWKTSVEDRLKRLQAKVQQVASKVGVDPV